MKKLLILGILAGILLGLSLYAVKYKTDVVIIIDDSNKEKAVIVVLNEANFKEETAEGVVLVDFYADWCGPCRSLAPVLANLTEVKVGKVDIDAEQELAKEYKVSSIPLMVFFKDGEEVSRLVGLHSQVNIQKVIDALKD